MRFSRACATARACARFAFGQRPRPFLRFCPRSCSRMRSSTRPGPCSRFRPRSPLCQRLLTVGLRICPHYCPVASQCALVRVRDHSPFTLTLAFLSTQRQCPICARARALASACARVCVPLFARALARAIVPVYARVPARVLYYGCAAANAALAFGPRLCPRFCTRVRPNPRPRPCPGSRSR